MHYWHCIRSALAVLAALLIAALLAFGASGDVSRVGIEAGHTRATVGAVSCDGALRECDITLSVALKVAQILRSSGYVVDVFSGDAPGTLPKSSIRNYEADAFVSLHADYCAGSNTGFKVSRYGGRQGTGTTGKGDAPDELVEELIVGYSAATGLPHDTAPGHYTRQMLSYWAFNPASGGASRTTPSAIIEMGWLSGDASFMSSGTGQQKMARGIASGIHRFLSGSRADSDGGSLLAPRLELALGSGLSWRTDSEFNQSTEDPWAAFAEARATVGVDLLALEAHFSRAVSLVDWGIGTTVLLVGLVTQLDDVTIGLLAGGWVEPYPNPSWIVVTARTRQAWWGYAEVHGSVPIRSGAGYSLRVIVGVELGLF